MKISTNQMFTNSSNQIVSTQSKIADMQAQLSTGTKLVKPSDEPQLAAVVLRLETAIAQHDSFQRNLNLVDERLAVEESIVSSVDNMLIRVRELALQGASDTVSESDRKFIAVEVQGLRDALFGLANAQDKENRYLFAGSQAGSSAFQTDDAGRVSYAGDYATLQVDITKNRSVDLNRPGTAVFGSVNTLSDEGEEIKSGFFDVLDDLILSLQNDDAGAVGASIGSLDVIQEHATLALVSIGVERSTIEGELDIHEEAKIILEAILSKEKDVDYSVLVTELSAKLVALEAVQSSFAKISQMSLLDYIR